MKLNHSILLLTLSLATALTLLSEASPTPLPNTHHASLISSHQQESHPPSHPNIRARKSRTETSSDFTAATIPSQDKTHSQRLRRQSTSDSNVNQRLSSSLLTPSLLDVQSRQSSKIVTSGKSDIARQRPVAARLSAQKKKTRTLVKRALPAVRKSPTTPKSPLLLLPDSSSVWQTGSYQTVKWSLKYTKSLPKDTTVDIILVDSKTNQKVSSLKRFVPFKKGSAQVWVPVNLPEGLSFVLVLELYRGRSQEQVTSTIASSSTQSSSSYQGKNQASPEKVSDAVDEINYGGKSSPSTSTDVFSTVVRRSDISISPGARKVVRDAPYPGAPGSANGISGGAFGTSKAGAHHDINNDDYYTGAATERPLEFSPEEMRDEYPNTVLPLVLEHTFGLHQKVYTMTPYTLEWKIPDRIRELLEYTRQVQSAASLWSKNSQKQLPVTPKSIFLAKVLVELVTEQTLEPVVVMARDIPAETMFQYLSIQERIPQAFYRLRVQMVVVQVNVDGKTLNIGQVPPPITKSKSMEGWEFPNGGQVIDRYEAVTRRFWVSQGAL
ncbi:hypothetical protein BGX26_010186 [Mortierella sp. AD094]|nr:hypothetical protein BGX26_010186 [Mortierella sp. AD094]